MWYIDFRLNLPDEQMRGMECCLASNAHTRAECIVSPNDKCNNLLERSFSQPHLYPRGYLCGTEEKRLSQEYAMNTTELQLNYN